MSLESLRVQGLEPEGGGIWIQPMLSMFSLTWPRGPLHQSAQTYVCIPDAAHQSARVVSCAGTFQIAEGMKNGAFGMYRMAT